LIHTTLAPQATAGAVLKPDGGLIQNSIVKSAAPTSIGGPGSALAGSSMRI
jgi:hypothetical protein